MPKTTGVTGFIVNGNYAQAVTIVEDPTFKCVDRSSGVEVTIDLLLTRWITQRAVASAAIRAGVAGIARMSMIRLDKIATELKKDKRAALYGTEAFVRKMDPARADQILAAFTPAIAEAAA